MVDYHEKQNIFSPAWLLFLGDLVSPGMFRDHLTTLDTSWSYHDSAEGYLFEFAVNLQTLNYLQTINLLNATTLNATLEYMQTGWFKHSIQTCELDFILLMNFSF